MTGFLLGLVVGAIAGGVCTFAVLACVYARGAEEFTEWRG